MRAALKTAKIIPVRAKRAVILILFWKEIPLHLYFVCQIVCSNQRILVEISAFLAKQRFKRIFHENPDLSGFSVKSSIYADVRGPCRNPVNI